jgi:hypothetical protein
MDIRRTKEQLEQVLNNMPRDFSLRDARLYVARALAEINRAEDKAEKKANETPLQKWKLNLETGKLTSPPLTVKQHSDALAKIEELIKAEEKKIESRKKKENPNNDMLLG